MAYHNKQTSAQFETNLNGAEKFNENQLMDAVNKTVVKVELDEKYTTKQKLKIYSELTSLSNCSEKERKKYTKKVKKLL
jgi:hypothetical protein